MGLLFLDLGPIHNTSSRALKSYPTEKTTNLIFSDNFMIFKTHLKIFPTLFNLLFALSWHVGALLVDKSFSDEIAIEVFIYHSFLAIIKICLKKSGFLL